MANRSLPATHHLIPAPTAPPPTEFQCAAADSSPAATDDSPPAWFTGCEVLPLCGYEVRFEDNDQGHRTCFHDAVDSGAPAEFAYVSIGDEGERLAHWFRVNSTGELEVIERSHPHDGPAGPTQASWHRYTCTAFQFISAPGRETDNLPMMSACTPAENS